MKITKRDVAFFFLGIVTLFVIDSIYNWEECKQAVIDGWNAGEIENKVYQNH